MGKSGSADKPFAIPKQLVWEAYQRVKANKGAAGVDGQSIADFEVDLKNNGGVGRAFRRSPSMTPAWNGFHPVGREHQLYR